MKKNKLLILILAMLIILPGCSLTKDSMEDITIYSTIYPVKYLIENLYGEYSTIHSIYPSGIDPSEYELSEKKMKEYANTDLFVFNSLDKDRDFAVDMINENKDLKIIDVSLGMTYENDIAELWLNPYNYLMMAQNTKNGLLEYIDNPYLISNKNKTGIEDKYEELQYNLSRLDADMKENISLATYKTIVVDNDMFKFLEKYNLKVISLEENDNLNENIIAGYYNSNASFKDTNVNATKISAKDAYLVNTASGSLQVQSYYINGGNNLTIGATIVYQSAASKEKYETAVTELIGSISYSDDSLKAISTIEMYSEVFGAYKGVFNYNVPTEAPSVEDPSLPNVEQNNENVENEEKIVNDFAEKIRTSENRLDISTEYDIMQ